MAFGSVFTSDPRPSLALLHSPHMVLSVHELVADVNELEPESARGSATCVCDSRLILAQETRGYIIELGRLPTALRRAREDVRRHGRPEDRFLMK
jgi:hypothetical protein